MPVFPLHAKLVYSLFIPILVLSFTTYSFATFSAPPIWDCTVNGGSISTADSTIVCANDGDPDNILPVVQGHSGANSAWVLTEAGGKIFSLPTALPINFEGLAPDIIFIRHLSYDNGLTGLAAGNNIADLQGCFDFSDSIKITLHHPIGGTVNTNDPTTVCAGDGIADLVTAKVQGNAGANSAWILAEVLTQKVVAVQASPTFNFDGYAPNLYGIVHLSYEDGTTASSQDDIEGCYAISSNFIGISVNNPVGGTISTAASTSICAGDGLADPVVFSVQGAQGTNKSWVIIDQQGIMTDIQTSPSVDFERFFTGIYSVRHLSYEPGLAGLTLGNNINALSGCFEWSNTIPVTINRLNGGVISYTGPAIICAGDGLPNLAIFTLDDESGPNFTWVITDQLGLILDLPTSATINVDNGIAGTSRIMHLSYVTGLTGLTVGNNISSLQGCFDFSNVVEISRQKPDAGTISTTFIQPACIGNNLPDPVPVSVNGNIGNSFAWIITNNQDEILTTPTTPPFDVEIFGAGVHKIWHLSYYGTLAGLQPGNLISTLSGCYDLSNALSINAIQPNGGTIATSSPTVVCSGNAMPDSVKATAIGAAGTHSGWLVTDTKGILLAIQNNGNFDFETPGPDSSIIRHISYETGLIGLSIGNNISGLQGCFHLSNSLLVIRPKLEGGVISTSDALTVCNGDGKPSSINVSITGNQGNNRAWVVTDTDGTIRMLPTGPVIDFENTGAGTSLIRHLSYETGLTGLAIGNNISSLSGCYKFSNALTVIRQKPDGGVIVATSTTTLCAADGIPDVVTASLTGNVGKNSTWLVTDTQGKITVLRTTPSFTFNLEEAEILFIWHLSYEDGLTGLKTGNGISDIQGCFDLSNSITITSVKLDGGTISTDDPTNICAGDGSANPIDLMVSGHSGKHFKWVVLDATGLIRYLSDTPTFDLEADGLGARLIRHLSYDDNFQGLSINNNIANFSGCFSWSNEITVNLLNGSNNGGAISTLDPTSICAGDGNPDLVFVSLQGNSGNNSAWLIVDENDNIIDLPLSQPFNFDQISNGVKRLFHLSYTNGLVGLRAGNHLSQLEGCYDFSNPITVNLVRPDGGKIRTQNPTTICAGDGVPDSIRVRVSGNQGTHSRWLVTDTLRNILYLKTDTFAFQFDTIGVNTRLIWHLSYEDGLTGLIAGNNMDSLVGCFDWSDSIRVVPLAGLVNGGKISTPDGKTVCANDGTADWINVTLQNASGKNSAWLITDFQRNILSIPSGSPFNMEGGDPGNRLIWHLSYADGLAGLKIGNNLSQLQGCFDWSDSIPIIRLSPHGGSISATSSSTVCGIDGSSPLFQVTLQGNTGSRSAWIIADQLGNIIALPTGPPFNLNGFTQEALFIRHLSYEGELSGASIGNNTSDLLGCYHFSNTLAITRRNPDGGLITTTSATNVCVGDGLVDPVTLTLTGSKGKNSVWVTTNVQGMILSLQGAPTFEFESLGNGTTIIWHLSYEDGLTGLQVGRPMSALEGCYDWSNSITVKHSQPNGGTISTQDPVNLCVGDGQPDNLTMNLQGAIGKNSLWVLTDFSNNILSTQTGPIFSFEGTDAGVTRIWHLSYEDGLSGIVVGNSILALSGCFDLSNAILIVKRRPEGGVISTSSATTLCMSGVPVDVTLEGAKGKNRTWIVTDNIGKMVAMPASSTIALQSFEPGNFLIWNLSYEDGLSGLQIGNNLIDLQGCYDLSNSISIVLQRPEGGEIKTDGSSSFCSGTSAAYNVAVQGHKGKNSAWVITDAQDKIIALPNNPPFNLSAFSGLLSIRHLSYETGLTGLLLGAPSAGIAGCFDWSNSIVITGKHPEAGTLSTTSPSTLCSTDGVPDIVPVTVVGNEGPNSSWVITDDKGKILALPPAPPFNLEGLDALTCLIWNLCYESGLTGLSVGNNAAALTGCFDWSEPITIRRQKPQGGTILTTDATQICASSPPLKITIQGQSGKNSAWVITTTDDKIVNLPGNPPFQLSALPSGQYIVRHLSYEDGLTGLAQGNPAAGISGCFHWSNAIILTQSNPAAGTVSLTDGALSTEICAGDGKPDVLNFKTSLGSSPNYRYLLTNTSNIIVAAPAESSFDFETSSCDTCRVWGLTYTGSLLAKAGDNLSTDLLSDNCYGLSSNFVTVRRATSGSICITGTRAVVAHDWNIHIAPNPASAYTDITFYLNETVTAADKKADLIVFNLTGQMVELHRMDIKMGENRYRLPTGHWVSGFYLLQVRIGNKVGFAKIIRDNW